MWEKANFVRRFEWFARPWTGCMWSVGLFPVADTCERVSDSVGGSRNKRLAERLALCSVYKYLSPFK